MLNNSRMVYLFLYVSDLSRSREFYSDKLGLRILEEDPDCVKFDVGQAILALNRAEDYGLKLPEGRDSSADVVFLVDNIDVTKAALESRGVTLGRTDRYEPGAINDFYDPDGHWLTLYQPNDLSLTWPSGARVRAVMDAREARGRKSTASNGKPVSSLAPSLDGCDLLYVFLFVKNPDDTVKFYKYDLGLQDLEGGPCSRGTEADSDGVIKYDTGGVMLTTHRIYEDRTDVQVDEHMCPPNVLKDGWMRTVAPVLYSSDVAQEVKEICQKRPGLEVKTSKPAIGTIASLQDPSGHQLYLYEPSAEALHSPSGLKIQEILATNLEGAVKTTAH